MTIKVPELDMEIEAKQENYRFLKLKNGDNIICLRLLEPDENHHAFVVYSPVIVTMMSLADGSISIGLAKWIPYTDERVFDIYVDDIVLVTSLNEEASGYYSQALQNQQEFEEEEKKEKEEAGSDVEIEKKLDTLQRKVLEFPKPPEKKND